VISIAASRTRVGPQGGWKREGEVSLPGLSCCHLRRDGQGPFQWRLYCLAAGVGEAGGAGEFPAAAREDAEPVCSWSLKCLST